MNTADKSAPRLTAMCSTGGCAAKYDPNMLGLLIGAASTGSVPGLLVGLASPDDAAVLSLGDESALVFTIDFFPPVVDDPHSYGHIAANNALGDIFAMNGEPRIALAVAGIPADLPAEVARDIVDGARVFCEAEGAVLAGGHTITSAEPLFGLAAVGFAHPDTLWRKSGARPGDVLILTKALGSGIAATAHRRGEIDADVFDRAVAVMMESNGSAARVLRRFEPSAVTDITGFGLLGHAAEVAAASGALLAIDLPALPVIDGVLGLAHRGVRTSAHDRNRDFIADSVLGLSAAPDHLLSIALDPQTAGGLLIAVPQSQAEGLLTDLRAANVSAFRIGEVRRGVGITLA